PALTALLLRPRAHTDSGDGERRGVSPPVSEAIPPLPRIAFPLAGAWLGWEFLAPWLHDLLVSWAPFLPVSLSPAAVAPVAAIMAGILLGWVVSKPLNRLLGIFFRGFNLAFNKATNGYVRMVGGLLRISAIALLVYGGLLVLTYLGFAHVPKGFIP